MRLSFLASHNGSAARSIIEDIIEKRLDASIGVVITNNKEAPIVKWCQERGIGVYHISNITHPATHDEAIARTLNEAQTDLVLLSGYMKHIGDITLKAYENKILNIHPSLLPKHGGKGLYGDAVHESVLKSGDKKSGATVMVVTKEYDTGPILAQQSVEVYDSDDIVSLKHRVQQIEPALYIQAIQKYIGKK